MAAIAAGLLCLPSPAPAQPSADQVLTDVGLSDKDKQRVLNGEFVTVDLAGVSERDLAFAIAFLVKTTPDALSKQLVAGDLVSADAQVQAHGAFKGAGSLGDLTGLKITSDEARALASAKAGDAMNLSAGEIAAFKAAGGTPEAVQQELRKVLLARYQAYRTAGLAGMAPYDRGGGRATDVPSDLRKASEAVKELEKYLPAFQKVLLGYPKATAPGLQENFFWAKSIIEGKTTYVLTHILTAPDGAARAVARRQYYVSTGYNGEQSVAGFLPVQGGSVVVLASHAFTDQVTGFGGSMKRSIGSSMMASKMKQIFEAGRKKAGQ
ncbi:MAG: hypothetical protein ACREEP_20220 [Dongiaceae bacterium]